jgi:sulfoxide reductase heme-binding subunit YedZ
VISRVVTSVKSFGWQRILTHIGLAAFTLFAILVLTRRYLPYAYLDYLLVISCGYLCLFYIGLTLCIGAFKLLRQRRVPVNVDLRRDIGIWAGITGLIHVVLAFGTRYSGEILPYFFYPDSFRPLLTRFGIANDFGLAATIVLILLLVTSNDWSLRKLKGKRWKSLQRLNYLLVALALLHTFLYQDISRREFAFTNITLVLTMVVLLIQALGFVLYRSQGERRMLRRSTTAAKSTSDQSAA